MPKMFRPILIFTLAILSHISDHIYAAEDDGAVVQCGNRWFSKITSGTVNAQQICIDHGYEGRITEYGGNGGVQCYNGTFLR